MKKSMRAHRNTGLKKLPFCPETIRILTEQELTLVVAGNCLNASVVSQMTSTNERGTC